MKNLIRFSFILLLFYSCKKETVQPEPEKFPHWGSMSALQNGKNWVASPIAGKQTAIPGCMFIAFDSIDRFDILREKCSLYKAPFLPGTYRLAKTTQNADDGKVGARFFFAEEDVLLGVYNISESDSSSFITVLSFDSLTKEVKGTFDITFTVEVKPGASAPDTIHLQNGTFHTKLVN